MPPRPSNIRFRVDPRDVPAEKAARRLHLTPGTFADKLPELLNRGFPPPDPTTGMFDLDAIDQWRAERHKSAISLTTEPKPRNAAEVFNERRANHGRTR